MSEYTNIRGFVLGESVICILNNRSSLTVGKEYTIVDIESNSEYDEYFKICVKNDTGYQEYYTNKRFETISWKRHIMIESLLK